MHVVQVQDIVREYSCRFCKDLVRPLQLARVTVALYPSVGDVVSISAHLGASPGSPGELAATAGRPVVPLPASQRSAGCHCYVHTLHEPQLLPLSQRHRDHQCRQRPQHVDYMATKRWHMVEPIHPAATGNVSAAPRSSGFWRMMLLPFVLLSTSGYLARHERCLPCSVKAWHGERARRRHGGRLCLAEEGQHVHGYEAATVLMHEDGGVRAWRRFADHLG